MKTITVIIPTLNDEKVIADCLRGLKDQTYKDFDILIVDGYSKDKTVEIAKNYGAKVVYDDGNSRASACNTAMKYVSTPYLIFTDADCIPFPNWLEEAIYHLTKYNCDSIGGINLSSPDDNNFAKAVDVVFSSKVVTGNARYGKAWYSPKMVNHNPGCNVAYKTQSLKSISFDEDLPTAEDVVADYKIKRNGGIIYFTPDMIVYHRRRNTIKSFFKQIYRYGMGRAIANKRYKELFSIFHALPSLALLLALPTVLILFEIFKFTSLYLISLGIVLYILLCFIGVITSSSKYKSVKTIIIATILVPLAHIAWGLGYLRGVTNAKVL